MIRRDFFKSISKLFLGILGIKLVSACGQDDASLSDTSNVLESTDLPETLKIWSYYVPLTSYNGIIEDFEGRPELDRRVMFEKLRAVTTRISGRRDDGIENRAKIKIADLRAAEDSVRVQFWHDDTDASGLNGHTLHLFRRYLDQLDAGEKVYVATGTFLNHFHVVMLDPTAAGLKKLAGES